MKIEVRNNKVIIDGYVNAVERYSKVLYDDNGSKFIERIMPDTFKRAIENNSAIKVLVNHDYDKEVANTKDKTATLCEDNVGLRAIVEISDEEVIKKAKEKKLRGWSFGFIRNKYDEVVNKDGIREISVTDIDLREISIIDDKKTPAYIGTSIEMRDDKAMVIHYRIEEFDEDSFSFEQNNKEEKPNFENMTSNQKREALNSSYKELFIDGWLEDYDDSYVYGSIDNTYQLYKIPYFITNGTINIDINNQVKVVRGGYREIRSSDVPEQPPNVDVEKIDYSKYKNILKKIRRN